MTHEGICSSIDEILEYITLYFDSLNILKKKTNKIYNDCKKLFTISSHPVFGLE